MASTYSTNLAIELIGTGDQSGTWGTTTNTNLGTLIEQAISGYVTYACSGGTDTITIPNGASGVARNMYIELTGTGGGTVLVPANKKLYFIYNNTASNAVTVKVSGQTGVSVPNGKKMVLVSNGTDVVEAANYITSFSTGSLSVASLNVSGLTASQAVFTDGSKNLVSNAITGSGNVVMSTSPTLVTPALGTPSSVTLTNATGLPISTGVSGLGTGVATALAVNIGTAGSFVVNGGALGTPSSGTVTNLTGTASININGTVGATTPNTGAFTTLSTTGALTYGGVTLSNSVTGTGSMVLSASPTITTPTLSGTTTAGAINASGVITSTSSNSSLQAYQVKSSNDGGTNVGIGVFGSAAGSFGPITAGAGFLTTDSSLLVIGANNASGVVKIAVGSSLGTTGATINSSGMNGTLGATTPAAATVTTLSASGQVSMTGGALRVFGALDAGQLSANVMDWQSTGSNARFLSYGPNGVAGNFTFTSVVGNGAGTVAATITSTGINSTVIGATTPAAATGTIIKAAGSSATITLQRRDTQVDAWNVYSAAGNMQFYDANSGLDRLTLTSGVGVAVTGTLSASGAVTIGPVVNALTLSRNADDYAMLQLKQTSTIIGQIGVGAAGEIVYNANAGSGTKQHVFQTSGSNRAVIDSTGLAVTGTLSATSSASFNTGSGNVAPVTADRSAGSEIYIGKYAGTQTFSIGGNTTATGFNTAAGLYHSHYIGATEIVRLTSTGLAVTGTLSATGNATIGATTGVRTLTVSSTDNNASAILSAGNGATAGLRFNNSSGTQHWNIYETFGGGGAQGALGVYNEVAGATQLLLDTSGNLGLGTSSPSAKLDVRGTTEGALFSAGSASNFALGLSTANGNRMYLTTVGSSDESLRFVNASGVELMRLASAGNLAVTGSSSATDGTNGYIKGYVDSSYAYLQSLNAAQNAYRPLNLMGSTVSLSIDGTVKVLLDNSGNLGLKATPSAWSTRYSVLEQYRGAWFGSFDTAAAAYVGCNFYYDSNLDARYVTTAAASMYKQNAGKHEFVSWASGTAGDIVSSPVTTTIDASGNLLVGLTSTSSYLDGRLNVVASGTQPGITAKLDPANATTTQFVYSAWAPFTSGDNVFMSFETETSPTVRGSISYNRGGGVVAYNTTSDYRAKDLFGEFTGSGAIIDSLTVYDGLMKGATIHRPMFVAHEAQAVVPFAVTGEKDAVDADGNPVYQTMDHQILVPLLVAEVKSLRSQLRNAGINIQ